MPGLPHPNTVIDLAEERRKELLIAAEAYHRGRVAGSTSDRHPYWADLAALMVMLAMALLLVVGLAEPREPTPQVMDSNTTHQIRAAER